VSTTVNVMKKHDEGYTLQVINRYKLSSVKYADNYRESFHFDVEVDNVAHLVEKPIVNLGQTIQHLVSVASLQCRGQNKHALVCRI